ncbi:MAG: sodium:proton antiporter [Planctomycetaceae bacterium]|jgi:Na+/H+ antiporter NhaC|nr:sodium:proton antiporter [Planctomycetaceae bacterium]
MLSVSLPWLLSDAVASSVMVDAVEHRFGVWSLAPPLLAIGLAIGFRRVAPALLAGVTVGALIVADGDVVAAARALVRDYLVGDSASLHAHGLILIFTTLLGTMVGVITRNGAMQAVISRLIRPGRDRCHGQQLTCGLGLAVFFDDYANTLVVGTSMRPITDRLRISREKLAFLVDATAAPVAGLAVISTWVGYEVGLIHEVYADLGQQVDAYWLFLETIPYRFYSILLLVFVWVVALTGRDFGPMAGAERRAVETGEVSRPGSSAPPAIDALPDGVARRPLVRNALVPLIVLIGGLIFGLTQYGSEGTLEVMLGASLAASLSSLVMTLATRALSLRQSLAGWCRGGASMLQALWVLVLAWALAAVCNPDNLGTAEFLVETTGRGLPAEWMPALSFVLAAAIALATGSSFSTMALLIPLSVPVCWNLLPTPVPDDPILLGTLGAVLAGAIFGDHCSPISDTTILSSAAAGCDHLDHVSTQAPYAFVVALVALVAGYVPVGLGVPVWVCLPVGLAAVIAVPRFVGRKPTARRAMVLPAKTASATDSASGANACDR